VDTGSPKENATKEELEGHRRLSMGRDAFQVAIILSLALLSACASFGSGIAELPAASGWERLPIRSWLLNEGLGPATIVYCPARSCARPAVVATFSARGETAAQLLRALADTKALLAAKRVEAATARDPRFKRKVSVGKPKSSEHAEPLQVDGLKGYRVSLSPDIAGGSAAYAVVLAKRDGDLVKAALAVTTDPEAALQEARAAAKTF
jgi:hypothetical protein